MITKSFLARGMAICLLLAAVNGVEARKIGEKFKHADKNKDGHINVKEYRMEKKFEKRKKAKVSEPWEVKADKNKDGYVEPREAERARIKKYLAKYSTVNRKWEKKADSDKNGKVSAKELRSYYLTVLDKDGNGKVDAKERRKFWISKKSKVNTPYEKRYDVDGNGYISGEEARAMLRDRLRIINTHGKVIVDTALEYEYDADSNGIIDKEEAQAIKDAVGTEESGSPLNIEN